MRGENSKYKIIKRILLTIFITAIFYINISTHSNAESIILQNNKKNVLFINSYSPNAISFDKQLSGLIEVLGPDVNLQIEYMDYGNFSAERNEILFYNLLKYKMTKYQKFDLVILADDPALDFGKKYRESLFKDIPIVFLGANDVSTAKEMVSLESTYGILEKVPIVQNVELISKLHDNKNIVAVIFDSAKNSQELKEFYSLKSKFKNLNFKHIPVADISLDEFKSELNKLNKDDVLLSIYSYEDEFGFKKMLECIDELAYLENIPIYNTLDFLLNDNFIGGAVTSGIEIGKVAGEICQKVLNGEILTTKLIDTDKIFEYIFNYEQLKMYNIKENNLPQKSIIKNKPPNFWKEYIHIIIPTLLLIACLLFTIIILTVNYNKIKLYEKELLKAKDIAENTAKIQNDFICNISHELRTPVAVIISSSQLLDLKINNNIPIKNDKNMNIIKQNSYRLLRLVNNIIDVARIDSGFMKLRLKNVEIISLLENLVLSIVPYATSKNLEVLFDTEEEELIMCVDPDKIERMVLNLLSNAIKFSNSKGKILATISKSDNCLLFSIKDEGIGIDQENLDNIFKKFTQVEDTMVRQNEGSGIGLSLVKSFADLHDGNICVSSILGKGSTFTIELPIRTLENENTYTYNIDNSQNDLLNTNIELSDIYI
ncbi:MAG: sensor histidine kinase [Romboutsia sp.]|uniref:sensor histidine kinase n=1 Tax=Romboutsia sp. TaxID=1965302 RepID=UPI003F2FFD16